MKSKAKVIRRAVNLGINDLNVIHNMYNNMYAEGGRLPSQKLREVVITPDDDYNIFLNTLPDNLRLTPESDYRNYRSWELHGKPRNFNEGIQEHMYTLQEDGYHGSSVAYNRETGNYEFLKPKDHPTLNLELDWYNSNDPDAVDFRKHYYLDKSTNPYQYKPIVK